MIGRVYQRLKRSFPMRGGGNLILMYHRVDDPPADPWGLCVNPQRFAEQMEVLRRQWAVCRLAAIQEKRQRVAVTFDDGYADNLYEAKSVLERYEIPATIFIVGGEETAGVFWWDELEDLLLYPTQLPARPLVLRIDGQEYRWSIDADDWELNDADPRKFRDWIAWKDDPPTSRHAVFRAVWEVLQRLGGEERSSQLNEIQCWTGTAHQRTRARRMDGDELRRITDNGLIELGAHTMNHPKLSTLSPREQAREILGSRQFLKEILGRQPSEFSYPFGGAADYTAATIEAVREAGFERACCTTGGAVKVHTDPFQLPRAHVENWGGEEFSRWLQEQLH